MKAEQARDITFEALKPLIEQSAKLGKTRIYLFRSISDEMRNKLLQLGYKTDNYPEYIVIEW